MNRLKLNILASFAGTGWLALMQVVFVPFYIKFLGIEAYGLIGFFAMLQASLQALDFGLSQTMNRELARYSAQPEKAAEARDLVRTLEIGYWAIGITIGIGVCVAAPYIAVHWIKAGAIPIDVVQRTITIMGVVSALQWPLSFYQGGLLGLERQVLLNGIKIGIATLSNLGSVFVLWRIAPTITAFFAWQIVSSFVHVILVTILLWRSLPHSQRSPRFAPELIKNIWRFAAGMSGITFFALILTQLDKVILSRMLTLEMFGYYSLATLVVNGLHICIAPIFQAVFPRLSTLVAMNDEKAVNQLYHQSTQLMAVLVLSSGLMLAFYSFDVMFLWTSSVDLAQNTAPIVSLLAIGTMINGLMNLPYALQLAYGWTSLPFYKLVIMTVTLVPGIIFMTTHYGPIGAASVWVVLNVASLLITLPLTHRRLLRHEMWRWYRRDVALPLMGALLVVGGARWLITSPMPRLQAFTALLIVSLCALIASSLAAPIIKVWIFSKLWKRSVSYT